MLPYLDYLEKAFSCNSIWPCYFFLMHFSCLIYFSTCQHWHIWYLTRNQSGTGLQLSFLKRIEKSGREAFIAWALWGQMNYLSTYIALIYQTHGTFNMEFQWYHWWYQECFHLYSTMTAKIDTYIKIITFGSDSQMLCNEMNYNGSGIYFSSFSVYHWSQCYL